MTFGQFVKVFMTDAGMNQKQLAEKLGFKQPRIGFWNKTNAVPVNARINYLSNAMVISRQYDGLHNRH